MDANELLPAKTAAEMLGVSQATISRWAKRGVLTVALRGDGRRGHTWSTITGADVEWLLDGRSTGTAA